MYDTIQMNWHIVRNKNTEWQQKMNMVKPTTAAAAALQQNARRYNHISMCFVNVLSISRIYVPYTNLYELFMSVVHFVFHFHSISRGLKAICLLWHKDTIFRINVCCCRFWCSFQIFELGWATFDVIRMAHQLLFLFSWLAVILRYFRRCLFRFKRNLLQWT